MNRSSQAFLLMIVMFFTIYSEIEALDRVYPFNASLNVRSKPTLESSVMTTLPLGRWLEILEDGPKWKKIRLPGGEIGYVSALYVTKRWIKIWKKEHRLLLMDDEKILKNYPIALGPSPDIDKVRKDDGSTPLGSFFISEAFSHTKDKMKYGVISLLLSYPNREDARRGLQEGLILSSQYMKIIKAINEGSTPMQDTPLGGNIRIHGGGIGTDWTTGSIAMKDKDIEELVTLIPKANTRVEIYTSMLEDQGQNQPGAMNRRILSAAKEFLATGCMYSKDAEKLIPIDFPMGDFDPKIGTAADVIIRILRKTGINLQSLIYEDISFNRTLYPHIKKTNNQMDHRRIHNIKIFLDQHSLKISHEKTAFDPSILLPGDIVLLDADDQKVSSYNHIGIVTDTLIDGRPLVITLWGEGYIAGEMDVFKEEENIPLLFYRMFTPMEY